MPMDKAMDLHIAMQILLADEQSSLAVATSVHTMTKDGRSKFFEKLNKNAQLVQSSNNDKILTTEEAALAFAKGMISG